MRVHKPVRQTSGLPNPGSVAILRLWAVPTMFPDPVFVAALGLCMSWPSLSLARLVGTALLGLALHMSKLEV